MADDNKMELTPNEEESDQTRIDVSKGEGIIIVRPATSPDGDEGCSVEVRIPVEPMVETPSVEMLEILSIVASDTPFGDFVRNFVRVHRQEIRSMHMETLRTVN